MLTPEARAKAKEARKKAPSRREKMKKFAATFDQQRRQFPRTALPVIDLAERGSIPAAIKLHCLDCSGWQRTEVRDCVIIGCSLYPHRPFQQKAPRSGNSPPPTATD